MNDSELQKLDRALLENAPTAPTPPPDEWSAIQARIEAESAAGRRRLLAAPLWAFASGALVLLLSLLVQVEQSQRQSVALTETSREYHESMIDLFDSPAFAEEEDLPAAWIILAEGQE